MQKFTSIVQQPPSLSTSFVGRGDELSHITELMADPTCRLLTLVGPGGIGKTRLALEAAHRFVPPDSNHFVMLQPLTSSEFLVSIIADAVGFHFYSGVNPKQQLLDHLHEKSWLLVLDNFEHLLDGADLLSEILAHAPALRILVTSRERLNLVEEWVLDLGGLAFPTSENDRELERFSAVELFVQHAHRVKSSFTLTGKNFPAVARICRLVGGMPLGIELAASWVRVLSCETIAEEIERSLDILETSARNVEPRHRTMRAALVQSWHLLSDTERDVYMRLSVFRGGFSREAAEQVAGASLRTLSSLVDKSLLRVDASGRYDLHELLRQYAAEKLQEAHEDEATRDAHSHFFAEFLQTQWQPLRSHQQAEALDKIEQEFENIRSAWQQMAEKRNIHELGLSVYSLFLFCDLRGRFIEALAMFKQAEEALRPFAGSADVDRVIGQMLTRQSWFSISQMKVDQGRALAEEGLAILQRVGSSMDIALGYYSLCDVTAFTNDYQGLKRNAEQIAEIAREIGDLWLLTVAHFALANSALYDNNLEEARWLVETGSALADACGDVFLRGILLCIRGSIAQKWGDYAQAKWAFEQSLTLFQELGHKFLIGSIHCDLGNITFAMNDYSLAAFHYQQSLRILADIGGFSYYVLPTLIDLSQMWRSLEDKAKAVELLTLVAQETRALPIHREQSQHMLLQLASEIPPTAFCDAETRGRSLNLSEAVQEQMGALDRLIQMPIPTTHPSASPSADLLTARELEILRLIAEGLSNGEIAERLFIGVGTVKKHITHFYDKLDAKNRTQAVARARERQLLT
ncbi:MAG: LuxR C-terminal-related transcriptional regulator [Chloroflexota bacterium]